MQSIIREQEQLNLYRYAIREPVYSHTLSIEDSTNFSGCRLSFVEVAIYTDHSLDFVCWRKLSSSLRRA